MVENDLMDALSQKLAKIRAERRAALAKVEECDAVIRHLEELLPKSSAGTAPEDEPMDAGQGKMSVRGIVREYVSKTPKFTAQDVDGAVWSKLPDAKHNTIRVQLSYAVQAGLAKRVGPGEYEAA